MNCQNGTLWIDSCWECNCCTSVACSSACNITCSILQAVKNWWWERPGNKVRKYGDRGRINYIPAQYHHGHDLVHLQRCTGVTLPIVIHVLNADDPTRTCSCMGMRPRLSTEQTSALDCLLYSYNIPCLKHN